MKLVFNLLPFGLAARNPSGFFLAPVPGLLLSLAVMVKPALKWIAPILCLPLLAASDLFLFRGDFIYILPDDIGNEMVRYANRSAWRLFPEHTRYIDEDQDGNADYVAIAIGATGGYGMQMRYQLRQSSDGARHLGRWYWCVITDSRGELVYEKFNHPG